MTFARNESPGALRRVPIGRRSATLNVLIAGTSYAGATAAAAAAACGVATGSEGGGGGADAQPIAAIAKTPRQNRPTALTTLHCSAAHEPWSCRPDPFDSAPPGYIYPLPSRAFARRINASKPLPSEPPQPSTRRGEGDRRPSP